MGRVSTSHMGRITLTCLASGTAIMGANKQTLQRENRQCRKQDQIALEETMYWSTYSGTWAAPTETTPLGMWWSCMCPKGLALHHPAAGHLLTYATGGCPTNTGRNWTTQKMEEDFAQGLHSSALNLEAMAQLASEIEEKVRDIIMWEDIRHNPPPNLKISPIAMIPTNLGVSGQFWICHFA